MGLPTALDDSITYVQRFTAKNNDLDKSAKIFLAINDAILAGGGSAQTQASAIEQFAQSFSKGKPDLMEWRTLLTAMPRTIKTNSSSYGICINR
jgi:tape measure domain-containing protein